MTAAGFWAFLDEGIVGFAALALFLLVVLPMSPFIGLGWLFSRAMQAATPPAVDDLGE